MSKALKFRSIILLFIVVISCSSENTVMICFSRTSYKYHNKQCKGMRACTHKIETVTIEEAQSMGKTPCGFCY